MMKHVFFSIALSLLIIANYGCDQSKSEARLEKISSWHQLIGGPAALGHTGDYLLRNGKIQVIIQGSGFDRQSLIYSGGIIDADLVRPGNQGSADGGNGKDHFGTMFPLFFASAMSPDTWEIIDDGSNSGTAHLRVSGDAGDVIAQIANLTPFTIPTQTRFQNDYILEPQAQHLKVITSVVNESSAPLNFRNLQNIINLLPVEGDIGTIPMPTGDVLLFAAGSHVFLPGEAGFDVRFTLEQSYKRPIELPELPGLVSEFIAATGNGVSYGFTIEDNDRNFTWLNRGAYPQATKHSLLVPFTLESFTGAYHTWLPDEIPAGESFSMTKYLIIGDGDVGSIRDEFHKIHKNKTGTISGRVIQEKSLAPEAAASVVIIDQQGYPISQYITNQDGYFTGTLPPGSYSYRVLAEGRHPTSLSPDTMITITTNEKQYVDIMIPQPGKLIVQTYDKQGNRIPFKTTIVGKFDRAMIGEDPMHFLFDFKIGEQRRSTDLSWQFDPQQASAEYIEDVIHSHNGQIETFVRPGNYEIVVSRGMKYTIHKENIKVLPGQVTYVVAQLDQAIETGRYVGGDLHVHTSHSLDSGTPVHERIKSLVSAGLDFVVASDHNFVTDYSSAIHRLGAEEWLHSLIGVEYTTLEMGHFNAYPMQYDSSIPSHGKSPYVEPPADTATQSEIAEYEALPEFLRRPDRPEGLPDPAGFEWFYLNPTEIFDELRYLGDLGPDNTIVQVNHPRDTFMGYFRNFNVDSWTGVPHPPADFLIAPPFENWDCEHFSYDFDTMELLNGGRLDLLHAERLPMDVTAEELTTLPEGNTAGSIYIDAYGQAEYPGNVDDWFNFLNRGLRITGVGSSDSHSLKYDNPGTPRTYIRINPDEDENPKENPIIDDLKIVEALKSQRAITTNGPFVEIIVDTDEDPSSNADTLGEIGDLVTDDNNVVEVLIKLQTPPWIRVDRMILWINGQQYHQWDSTNGLIGYNQEQPHKAYQFVVKSNLRLYEDSWIAVEVYGDQSGKYSLWPVVTYKEEPFTNIDEALSGITQKLGFDIYANERFRKKIIQIVYPYAITNPVWIDVDHNGVFDAPESFPPACQPLSVSRSVDSQSNMDIRTYFNNLQ